MGNDETKLYRSRPRLSCWFASVSLFGPFSRLADTVFSPGNFGRTKTEVRYGKRKAAGYIKSPESLHIERLMEILSYFDNWQSQLQSHNSTEKGEEHAWKKHFITRESWFDLRLCVLGFVSTCRYLLDEPERFQSNSLSPNMWRFICSRIFSQVGKTLHARDGRLPHTRCDQER